MVSIRKSGHDIHPANGSSVELPILMQQISPFSGIEQLVSEKQLSVEMRKTW